MSDISDLISSLTKEYIKHYIETNGSSRSCEFSTSEARLQEVAIETAKKNKILADYLSSWVVRECDVCKMHSNGVCGFHVEILPLK